MPLGEVARCIHCKTFASDEELELNRKLWEYQCRDWEACLERQVGKISNKLVGHCSGFFSIRRNNGKTKSQEV